MNIGSTDVTILDNVISANSSGGVQAYAIRHRHPGQLHRHRLTGTQDLGNDGPGVEDSGSNIQVGGTLSRARAT